MYSTIEEVREVIKHESIIGLIGHEYGDTDEAEQESVLLRIIESAISDADGEIDGYLNKRYTVPLRRPSRAIRKYSKDIALFNIFSRIGIDKDSREEIYYTRYKNAIRFLENVAKGLVEIGETDEESQTTARPLSDYRFGSKPRVFSRDSLRRM